MTTKTTVFFTHTVDEASANDGTAGISNDVFNGATEVSAHILVDSATNSMFDPTQYEPSAITFDPALQTYYTYLTNTNNNNPTFFGAIYSGSTSTGTLNSTPLYSPLTTNQVNNYYTAFVNDVVDDPINHKLYFTQIVMDDNADIVTGQTGIYVMNENGTGVTKLVSGVTDPNALSIDVADGLIFFTDSTGYDGFLNHGISTGTYSAQGSSIENLDVASLTGGTAKVLLSEPYEQDESLHNDSLADGGPILNGIAVDPVSKTIYFTTNNFNNPPVVNGVSDDGIYKVAYTVGGGTASINTGAFTTLYSGTNSFDPGAITLDVPDGLFYVTGTTLVTDPYGGDDATNERVYEGSVTATNTTALTAVTPLSETQGSPAVTNGEQIVDLAADVSPTLVAGAAVVWESGSSPIVADSALTVTAGTSVTFISATVAIGSAQSGDTLAATTTGTSVTATFSGSTLTLSGTDTTAHYQQVLDSVTYTNTAGSPTTGARTLTYTLSDGIASSDPVTSTVTVRAKPTVTAGATVTFTGGGSPVIADAALSLTASSTLAGATVSVITNHVTGDVLGFVNQSGITGSFNSTTGVLTLSGTATVANYKTAIDSITFGFSPSNADPTNGGTATSRTISYTVTDGTGSSTAATSTVTVTHAAPSVTAGASPIYVTGGTAVAIDSALTVAAPDSSAMIASATVTIATNHNTADTLNFTNQNGITGVFTSATGVLSLTGSTTAANYQAALDSITFSSTNTSSTSARGIIYKVNDGTATSSSATSTVTVQHPTPTITGAVAGQAVSDEGTISPFSGVMITDSANQQDSATITLTASGVASDANGALSGTGVTQTGTGLYTVSAATPLSLTTTLDALVFTPTAHQVAAGSTVTTGFTLAIADTGAGSATNTTTTVVATAATDTPVISGTVANQATTDLVTVQPFSAVTITDPDDGVMPTVTVTLRSGGTATDANGTLSGTGITQTGVGTYTLTDTPANLTTDLRAASFAPTHDQVAVGQGVSTEFDLLVAVGGVSASNTTTSVNATDVPCYCRGTLILTESGEIPVEDLVIGAMVMTFNGALAPIRWIGRRSYAGAFALSNPSVWPVLVHRGALAAGIPRRDLYISPEHALFLDRVLVPARHLVNGRSIVIAGDRESVDYFHIELDKHGVIYAEGAAAETFVDRNSRFLFQNADEFAALHPDRIAAPGHDYAPMVESGEKLDVIQQRLARLADDAGYDMTQDGPFRGFLDLADRTMISGWAMLTAQPGVPVRLELLDNGTVITTLVANRYRADLEAAGIGDGRHSFEYRLPKPLNPFTRHEIEVRRAIDDAALTGSPAILEAAPAVDAALCDGLADLMRAAASRAADIGEVDAVLQVLAEQTERLKGARAELVAQCAAKTGRGARVARKRALVIDEQWAQPDHDAGSQAVISHIRALQRLGWRVAFVPTAPAHRNAAAVAGLRALDVECHMAPEIGSVEELLRRQAGCFDLVYLHRWSVASAYAGLVRQHQPRARCVYSVADLHHLRLSRQAVLEGRPEMMRAAQGVRRQELLAMGQVDAVITHSAAEASILARELPGAPVHVIPWGIRMAGPPAPWAERQGVVFVANFGHVPNCDALHWLAQVIMPAVWAVAPDITLTVAGVDLPASLRRAVAEPRIRVLGFVPDLERVYRHARVAVAPLRFGAGLKGKVLEAWAAGLPCVMTPVAAEGIPLAASLAAGVCAEVEALASQILALHGREADNARHVKAGRALLRAHFTQARVTLDLAVAVSLQKAPAAPVARLA